MNSIWKLLYKNLPPPPHVSVQMQILNKSIHMNPNPHHVLLHVHLQESDLILNTPQTISFLSVILIGAAVASQHATTRGFVKSSWISTAVRMVVVEHLSFIYKLQVCTRKIWRRSIKMRRINPFQLGRICSVLVGATNWSLGWVTAGRQK